MDTFKIETIQENKTYLQNTCFQKLQCMYNILIKPKVDDGTYIEQGGYKAYRDDFARLRENIKQRRPGVDTYIAHMCGLEFENRFRKQDEKILEKANLSEFEIKAEIQKQQKMIAQGKDELAQKEDLRKQSEVEQWKAYKDELSSERKNEQKELKEKYAKALEDWEKGKNDLERKLKENDEVISKLCKAKGTSGALVAQKPAMKETVLKTFLSLIPVVGPIASGVYERFSSP